MMTRVLLFSDERKGNKPELEIFADDVACGHGATYGGLLTINYSISTRAALPDEEAEALLIQASAAEAYRKTSKMRDLREALPGRSARWLAAQGRGMNGLPNARRMTSKPSARISRYCTGQWRSSLVYLDTAASAQKPAGN